MNTVVDNNYAGIALLGGSYDNTAFGNVIKGCYFGIILDNTNVNQIYWNTVYKCDFGIALEASNENQVTRNFIYKNDEGIFLSHSTSNQISRNVVLCNGIGIHLVESSDNTIHHNKVSCKKDLNSELFAFNTDPNNPDIDGDNYPDGYEIINGWDPLDPRDPSYSVHVDNLIETLENLAVPPAAEKEVKNALKDLNKSLKNFAKGEIAKAIKDIQAGIKDLMKAQKDGADVQSIIDELVDLVKDIVDNSMSETIDMIGDDNKHITKAMEKYNKALQKLAEGKYDHYVKHLGEAYKEIMKALNDKIFLKNHKNLD